MFAAVDSPVGCSRHTITCLKPLDFDVSKVAEELKVTQAGPEKVLALQCKANLMLKQTFTVTELATPSNT
jgi:hypothetical protein